MVTLSQRSYRALLTVILETCHYDGCDDTTYKKLTYLFQPVHMMVDNYFVIYSFVLGLIRTPSCGLWRADLT